MGFGILGYTNKNDLTNAFFGQDTDHYSECVVGLYSQQENSKGAAEIQELHFQGLQCWSGSLCRPV